ncbi:MAG: DUF5652 family protein [Candidatus Paceibacterota bacterium]|jgi:4-amino-4-deoxy-L-arabinose transferase-like glycosyltransferase
MPTDPQIFWFLILSIVWVLPWKGYALWMAAKRNDTKWFVAILILNTLAILEIIYIFFVVRRDKNKSEEAES